MNFKETKVASQKTFFSFCQQFYKPFLMVLGILILVLVTRYFHIIDVFLNDKTLLRHGLQGKVVFLIIAIIMCAVGFPRQIVCFTAGIVYGFLIGTVLATIATICGALLAFGWALWLGHQWAQKYLEHAKLRWISNFIRQHPFSSVLTCRLMPVGSSLLVNMAAGVVGIHFWPFIMATFLGSLPQTLVFVLLGGGVRIGHTDQIIFSLILLALSAGLGAFLMRKTITNKN